MQLVQCFETAPETNHSNDTDNYTRSLNESFSVTVLKMLHLIYPLTFLVGVVWGTGIMRSLKIRDLHDQYQRMGTKWGVEIYS